MPEDERFKGCDSHKGHTSILQCGNPTYDNVFTDSMDKIQFDCKRSEGSQLSNCYHALPSSHVTAFYWAILLLTCKHLYYLWYLLSIPLVWWLWWHWSILLWTEVTCHWHLWEHTSNLPQGFWQIWCRMVILILWNDEEYPEFGHVLILLCYLCCVGIKDVFLSPSKEKLKIPSHNGVFVTPLSYRIVMCRMNKIAIQVLGLVNNKAEIHTFCQTGYLYGRGGDDWVASMLTHNMTLLTCTTII